MIQQLKNMILPNQQVKKWQKTQGRQEKQGLKKGW